MRFLKRSRRRMMVTVVAGATASCAGRNQAVANESPRIEAVRPDTVVARRGSVVEVVIVGRGFARGAPGTNTLEFGGVRINGVPANASGTEIRLVIPENVSSRSEAPPEPLSGGTYNLRVITGAGTSNSVPVTVVR